MEYIKEEKRCIVCDKILVGNQKKYCSKECEIKNKKGKKIGPYPQDRVDAMARAKREAYEERYLNKFKPLIEEFLSYNYINNIPQLAAQINMPLINARKYFKYYSDKKEILHNTPNYPKKVQDFKPEKFFIFKDKLSKKDINAKEVKEIAIEYDLSDNEIVKSLVALRPEDSDQILNIKNLLIKGQPNRTLRVHKKYFSEEEKKEKSTSNQYKYNQVKKKFQEDHVENLFRGTLYFSCRDEYKQYLKDEAAKYGCMWKLLARYLKECNVKPELNYAKLVPLKNFSKRLNITQNELEELLKELLLIEDYPVLKKKYLELTEKYKDVYIKRNFNISSERIYENIRSRLEQCDTSGYLKRLRLSYQPEDIGTEKYFIFTFGKDFLEELKNDIVNIQTVENYSLFESKYFNKIKLRNSNSHFLEYANTINPNFIYFRNKVLKSNSSKYGGSSIEKKVISFLKEKDIEFDTQVRLKSDKRYGTFKIDIVLLNKYCIEIQGDYWHGNPLRYKLNNEQLKLLENSVFPGFIYNKIVLKKRKDLNEFQIKNFEKDYRKKLKMIETYGKDNIYYIWEYDIENNWEEVKQFLERLINEH